MTQNEIFNNVFHDETNDVMDSSYVLSYIKSLSRNHVVISRSPLRTITYTDAGVILANAINGTDDKQWNIDTLFPVNNSSIFGTYIALENIGILFEPQLKLDVRHIVDSLSKNNTLFICDTGVVENDIFHFFDSSSGVKVNLSGISHITLQN